MEDDSKEIPRVLRGLSPHKGLRKDEGRVSLKEKVLSGSRGGQSSWAYVNLAYEKDVDLILSPETLKRRKEERMARGERLKEESTRRKDRKEGKTTTEQGSIESSGRTEEPSVRGEDNTKVEMKTFGHGWDDKGGERRSDRTGDRSGAVSKMTRTTSNSWPTRKEERDEDKQTEGWERKEILRGYENLTLDTADATAGFRLKRLTREWETKSRRRGYGRKGGGSGSSRGSGSSTWGSARSRRSGSSSRSEASEGKEVEVENKEEEVKKITGRHHSPRVPKLPLSSHFSSTTKLLLSHEDEEEAGGGEERPGSEELSPPPTRSSADSTPEGSSDSLRQGEISFYADGKKRNFKYFSAQ